MIQKFISSTTVRVLVWCMALVVFSGCARPKYQTFTTYVPSQASGFPACVQGLEKDQIICRQSADMSAQLCTSNAVMQQMMCKQQAAADLATCKASGNEYCVEKSCFQRSCPPDYTICTDSYERGYSTCGGEVHKDTQCVKNCDKIKP
jgi:hypothetical protein